MRYFLLSLLILIISLNHAHADDIATKELNQEAWKLRVVVYGVISAQQSLIDLMQWCADTNDKQPCDTMSKVGLSSENDVKQYRTSVATMLKALENQTKTKVTAQHVRVLTEELRQLNALPTPYSEMLAEAMSKDK